MLNCFSGNGIKIWRKIAKVYFSNYLSMLSCTKSWRGKSQRFKYLPLISDKDRRLTNIYPVNSFFRTFFFFITVLVRPLCYEFPSCSWLFKYSSVKCYLLSKTVPFFREKVACLQLFWKIKFKITLTFFIRGLLMLHSTIK